MSSDGITSDTSEPPGQMSSVGSSTKKPVTLIPVSDRSNGWYELMSNPPEPKVLTGAVRCDYVVIGGGYSGLAATRRLAELDPASSVVLVDGERIGNNAAGRSSGFAIDHAHNLRAKSFADAKQQAMSVVAMNRAGLSYLDATITKNNIDCEWRKEGKYHAAATDRGERMLADFANGLEAIEEDHSHIDKQQCKEIFGTDFYRKAIHAPHSYLVQPAKMVRGLADTMPENVAVYEDSMVLSTQLSEDDRTPHTIFTERGSVTAPIVVLANNGFIEGFGFLSNHLIPLITWGSMTRELTDEESKRLGGSSSYGIIAAHPAGTSVRRVTTPDNRILVRNIFSFAKRSDFTKGKDRMTRNHRRSFEARWPQLADVPFEYSWGGALSLSRNGETVFGELARNVYGTVVHNGVGIARGTIGGKLLAELIMGHDSGLLSEMNNKGRPNRRLPFQDLGVRINIKARRIIAGAEE